MSGQEWWVVLGVAGISAFAAVVAAVIASSASRAVKRSELDAQKVRDLEDRLQDKKYEVYKPMINMLRDLLGAPAPEGAAQSAFTELLKDFVTWVSIFGSDDAVEAFHKFMYGAFKGAPMIVALRLYADFILAVRKDMGYPETRVGPEHLAGLRVNDIYDFPDFMDPSFDRLCERANWTPPWNAHRSTTGARKPARSG